MQPHAETVQGADSWLHQESDYFTARAAPRARAPCNLWACAMQGMGICIWGWGGQQDHSSPDAISFRYHSTVTRADSTGTPRWRIHSSHEDKGTATPLPSSPMRKEVSHSYEMSPKYGGTGCRKCAWSSECQRNSSQKEEDQISDWPEQDSAPLLSPARYLQEQGGADGTRQRVRSPNAAMFTTCACHSLFTHPG